MATISELLVRLGLDETGLKSGLAAAKRDLKGFGSDVKGAAGEAETASTGIGGALAKVGPAAGIAGAAILTVVGGIGVEAAKSASEFQSSMVQIENAMNISSGQADTLGQAIENASLTTDSSANTMAAALAPLAGELQRVAGGNLSAAGATDVLKAAQDLHEGTAADLDTSLKAITDTLLLYGKGTGDAASVADTFFQAQSQLGIPLDATAEALQRLQPRLVGAKLGFDQTLGLVREITPVVGTGGRALSSLGTVLQSLTAPSTTAMRDFANLGISITDVHGKFIGLPAALDVLHAAFAKLPPTTAKGSKALSQATLAYDLFGKQAQIGNVILAGGSAALQANTDALAKTGTAAGAAARNAGTLDDQQATLKATMSTMATTLGQALIPALSALASAVLPIITAIAGWISGHKELAGVILAAVGIVGALGVAIAVIGPIIGALAGVFGLVTTAITAVGIAFGLVEVEGAAAGAVMLAPFLPIILLVGAVIAIIVLLATHWQQLAQIVGAVVGAVVGFVTGLVSAIAGAVANIVGFFLSIPGRILAFEVQVGQQIAGLAAQAISMIADAVGNIVGAILSIPGRAIGWIAALISGVASAVAQFAGRVVGLAGTVVSTILGIPGRAVGWIAGFVGGVGRAAAGFLGAIVTMAGTVVSTILGIPGRLLGGLVSAFAGLAGSVVKAFINGLASLPGMVAGMLAKIPGVGLLGDLGGAIGGIFSSHEQGAWNIPGTQLAVLHRGEMVVPAGPAAALRASVTASGTGMGAGGGRPLVGTIVVNNPTPEPASTSISRELQKLTAFGYMNPAKAGVR